MDADFGARLRVHREARQLTLQAIAAQTKIKQSLLQGLESDDLSAWPKGIFRRAFVRDYARAVGLDPETVVRGFLERHPDPVEQTPFGPAGAPLTESDLVQVHSEPPTRLQRLIDAARTAVPTLLNRGGRATRLESHSHTSRADNAERQEFALQFDEPTPSAAVREERSAPVRSPALSVSRDAPVNHRSSPMPRPVTTSAAHAQQRIDTGDESRLEPDLDALAELCTRLALVGDWGQFKTALADATRIVHASGVMLWCPEAGTALLTAVAAHGYADAVLARVPRIHPEDDNAVADAFRSAAMRVVPADRGLTAAVAVPVMAPVGCVGVLAFELRDGREQDPIVTAAARIIAAQLASLLTPAEETHAITDAHAAV
jgi:cytoskeletal protein RodZ